MALHGQQLIGRQELMGSGELFNAIEPKRNERLDPAYGSGTLKDVDVACMLANEAVDSYRETALQTRAEFLESIADGIEHLGDELIERAALESGLAHQRVQGERDRTCAQLRLFAKVVRQGDWLDVCVDLAAPSRTPKPRPDIRRRQIAVGPVAVFGSSNFPLAFSVGGGDTASALAAGCPVIAKAHAAHPGTCELVGRVIQGSVKDFGFHEGVFSLLYDAGTAVGSALVADPRVAAVAFTGSRSGGLALQAICQQRRVPIPVFAEMSSINPVVVLPHALAARFRSIAMEFVSSLILGAGQFCTNPGLIVAVGGRQLDAFKREATEALAAAPTQTMLTAGICASYKRGLTRLANHPKVAEIARGMASIGDNDGEARLYTVRAADFIADRNLQQETFGAASIVIACNDVDEICDVVRQLEGQLTLSIQMDEEDMKDARRLLPTLERGAGRILTNGWPTGVEVCDAMIHGGPYPATTDSRSTSVGSTSVRRFLRPVCYQNFPSELLPRPLRDTNPLMVRRQINGSWETTPRKH